MTAAVNGAYGGYNYQSPEARALSSITQESYDYRDQGKLITKLTGDVSYLAGYMRKMQKGIDSANQNVVQQLQSLINDLLVIIGGGGDTGFDFGDLKYIFQAIGSLFGFGPGLSLPVNLGEAAWHFFSEYLLGFANFTEAINQIVDGVIGTVLDVLGEIPIIGQGAQMLAVLLSDIRDGINGTIDGLGQLISDLWNNPIEVISNLIASMIPGLDASKILSGQFAQSMINGLTTALENINNWVQDVIDAVIGALTGIPIIGGVIANIVNGFESLFNGLFGQPAPKATIATAAVPALDASKVTTGTFSTSNIPDLDGTKITTGSVAAARIASLDASKITTGTLSSASMVPALDASKITTGTLSSASMVPSLDAAKITTGTLGTAIVPNLDAGKITTGTFGATRIADAAITNVKLGTDISGDKIVAGTVAAPRIASLDASKITTGTLGTAIVPNLDAAKITTGTLGTAIVPNLDASKVTTGNFAQSRVTNLTTDLSTVTTAASTADTKAVAAQGFAASALKTGPNILPNGGFENTSFYTGNGVYDTTVKLSGSYSCKLTGTGVRINLTTGFQSSDTLVNSLPCRPLSTFYVEGWVYGDPANAGGGSVQIYVDDYNSAGVLQPQQYAGHASTTAWRSVWTKVSATITVSANAASVYIFIYQSGQPVTDVYYYDNFVAYEITEVANTNTALYNTKTPGSTILSGAVPNLDATKITTGTLGTAIVPNLDAGKITTGALADARIPSLATSKITSGTFGSTFIADSAITNVKLGTDISGDKIVAGTVAAPRVAALDASKITTGTLGTGLIPALPQSQITNLTSDLSSITTGSSNTLNYLYDAFDGTTGNTGKTAADVRDRGAVVRSTGISAKTLAVNNITSGTNLAIDPGFENGGVYIGVNAVRSTERPRSGTYSAKCTTTGSYYCFLFPQANDTAALTMPCNPGDVFYVECWVYGEAANTATTQTLWWQANAYRVGLATTNTSTASIQSQTTHGAWTKQSGYMTMPADTYAVQFYWVSNNTIPAGNIYFVDDIKIYNVTDANKISKALYNADVPATTVIAGAVPSLDATKITTGVLGTGIIPSLDAAKITTGAIPAARIGSLPTSQITSGTFASGFIADSAITNAKLGADISGDKIVAGTVVAARVGSLDGSKITTGTIGTAIVPSLDAAKITTGAFADARIPTLDGTKIGTGTVAAARIDVLDASKITTGNFTQARVTNLTTDLASAFSAGVNLAADPGFENPNLPLLSGTEYSTEFKRSGTRSVKITGLTGSNVEHYFFRTNTIAYITIPVQAGDTFYFEAWVRGGTGNTKSAGAAGIRPFLYSGDPAAPTLTYPANIADYTGDLATLNAGWNKLSGYYTVPAGGVGLRVSLQVHTSAGTGAIIHVDDLMCYRVTEAVATNKALYNANVPATTVLAGAVPSLDATKITTGVLGTGIIPSLDAAKITTGTLGTAIVPNLDAAKITTGALADARIPSLATSKITSGTFSSGFIADSAITNAKLGTDISGSKIVAGTVGAAYVAALDASKITTGDFAQARITNLTTDLSTIDTKAVVAQGLSATAMAAGANLLTNFGFENTNFANSASFSTEQAYQGTRSFKFTVVGGATNYFAPFQALNGAGYAKFQAVSGDSFYFEMMIFPHASNVTGSTLTAYIRCDTPAGAQVATPGFTITTATLTKGQWNKVSGYMNVGVVPTSANGVMYLSLPSTEGGNIYYVDNASLHRVTETINTNTALYGANVPAATVIAGAVPSLDATKITTGQIAEARIVDLSAAKITSGSLADARIPSLATSKITSGTFGSAFIADSAISNVKLGSDISGDKIVAGTVVSARVGALDASKVTTGTFGTAFIADSAITGIKTAALDASKITTGAMPQAQVTNLSTDLSNRVDFTTYNSLVAGGDNLCTNPGFEDTSQYIRDAVYATNVKNSGIYSAKLTSAGAGGERYISLVSNKTATVYVKGVPSQRFYVEFNIYGDDANTYFTGTTQFIGIGIWCYDKTTAYVTNAGNYLTADQVGKSAWVKYSGIIQIPSTSTIAFFYPVIRVTTTAPAGNSWYFDDIVLRNITDVANVNTALYGTNTPGATILTGAVPSLDATKITTGTLGAAIIGAGTIDNTKIASGVDAAKLTTGTLPVARIAAGAITNTYLGSDVDAAKLTAGTLPIARIADSAITTAKIGDSQITGAKTASLDASKITTGAMAQAQVTSLSTDLGNRVDYSAYLAYLSGGSFNLATNPSFEDTTQYLWSGTANTNATYVRSGTRSVSLTANGAYQYIGVCTSKTAEIYIQGGPSEKYYFEFYVKGDATNAVTGSAIAVQFGIWYADVAKTSLGFVAWTGLTYDQVGTAGWVKASGYVTIPSTSTIAFHRPIIYLPPTATAGKFYFDDVVLENVTEITAINTALYNANTPGATILTGAVPGLDASKITGGTLDATRIGAGAIDNTKIASGVDAAKLTTGTLPVARIAAGAITNTYLGSDVDAAKLTAGTLPIARIADAAITTAKIGDNQITTAKIPDNAVTTAKIPSNAITNVKVNADIDASKIFSGQLAEARIVDLSAAKITTGSFADARIPNLATSKITSGTFGTTFIADAAITGVKTASLDASKITTGSLAQANVTNLTTDLGLAQDTADNAEVVGLQNSSDILELQTEQTGGANSGYSATDSFTTVSTTGLDSTNWNIQVTGGGGQHLGTNGADAYWVSSGTTPTGNVTEFDYWKTATNTDYQLVTMIIGTRNNYPYGTGSQEIYARVDSTRQNYLKLVYTRSDVGVTTLTFYKVVAGVSTQLSTDTVSDWKAGDTVQLVVGNPSGDVRNFLIKRNNVTIRDITDTAATLSVVGANNRYAGVGSTANISSGGQFKHPGNIAAWSVSDNIPPTYVGSGFRAHKTSGTLAVPANNYNMLPNSFFTLDYKTADYTFDAATNNRLTVSISGWYHVHINIGFTINTQNVDMAVAVYKNGSLLKRGGSYWGLTSLGTGTRGPAGMEGNFIVYLSAGDYINPGYWSTTAYGASGTIAGDSAVTYFEVALINKSLL